MFQALKGHNIDYDWYTCESSVTFENPDQKVKGKTYIRIKRDSIIWSSVKKLSAEVARLLVTEDTYTVVNRWENTYRKGSTDEVFSKMGISLGFRDLQEAICGNVIIPDSFGMMIEKIGTQYVIKSIDQDLQLKYWINAYDLSLDKIKMIDYLGREISIEFADYRKANTGELVSYYRHFSVPFDHRGDSEIFLKIKNIEINVPKKTRFSIPSRYERVH